MLTKHPIDNLPGGSFLTVSRSLPEAITKKHFRTIQAFAKLQPSAFEKVNKAWNETPFVRIAQMTLSEFQSMVGAVPELRSIEDSHGRSLAHYVGETGEVAKLRWIRDTEGELYTFVDKNGETPFDAFLRGIDKRRTLRPKAYKIWPACKF